MEPEKDGRKLTAGKASWTISPEGEGIKVRYFLSVEERGVVGAIDLWAVHPSFVATLANGIAEAIRQHEAKPQIIKPPPNLKLA